MMDTATTGGWDVLNRQARVSAVASPHPSIGTDQDAERGRGEALLFEARERFRDAVNAADKQRREML
jgi:hypothetical protein